MNTTPALKVTNYLDRKTPYSDKAISTRVFVTIEGESILDDFGNRTSRPWQTWKPLVLAALKEHGIEVTKLRWSQHAGCSMCPCSPGFIAEGMHRTSIWITIQADEPQVTDPAEAFMRQVQLAGQI